MSNSKGWFELGIYVTNLVGKREGKRGHLRKNKWLFGKINGLLGDGMGDRIVCDICLSVVLFQKRN